MVTGLASQEDEWETLNQADLNRVDSVTVNRVRSLLRAAIGDAGEDRESRKQRKALSTLFGFTRNVILIKCRKYLGMWPSYHEELGQVADELEVTSLADRIFASHATGAPFISDAPYKTWLEIWQPEQAPFLGLVAVTAKCRCIDWLRSLGRDPHARFCEPAGASKVEALQGVEPSRPDQDFHWATLESLLGDAIDRIPGDKAREAIRAFVCNQMSVGEIAKDFGISENAAHNRVKRGASALLKQLIEEGHVSEGIGRNLISVGKPNQNILANKETGKTQQEFRKDSADGTA